MGKFLSLLILFHILATFQSCVGAGIHGKKSAYNTPDLFDDDAGLIVNAGDDKDFIQDSVSKELSAGLKASENGAENGTKNEEEEVLEYQTKKNETLMLVAFKIYGDYKKWRELYSLNREALGESHDLSHLPSLKYRKPLKAYTPPAGRPYLIKFGDSLSKISNKVYGNWRKWPIIHENNPKQIPAPNLIFAGFTLYYPSLDKIHRQLH